MLYSFNPAHNLQKYVLVEISRFPNTRELQLFEIDPEWGHVLWPSSLHSRQVTVYEGDNYYVEQHTTLAEMLDNSASECPGPEFHPHRHRCPLTPVVWSTPLTTLGNPETSPLTDIGCRDSNLHLNYLQFEAATKGINTVGTIETSWPLRSGVDLNNASISNQVAYIDSEMLNIVVNPAETTMILQSSRPSVS